MTTQNSRLAAVIWATGLFFVLLFLIGISPWVIDYLWGFAILIALIVIVTNAYLWYRDHPIHAYSDAWYGTRAALATPKQYLQLDISGPLTEAYLASVQHLMPTPPNPAALPPFIPIDWGSKYRDTQFLIRLRDEATQYTYNAQLLKTVFEEIYQKIARAIPIPPQTVIATVPLYEAINVKELGQAIFYRLFAPDVVNLSALDGLHLTLNTNRRNISQKLLTASAFAPKQGEPERVDMYEFPGTNKEAVDIYLGGTPFHKLFYLQVPFGMDNEVRFEHQWITGNTGTGKTTFLSTMIERDLDRVARGECCVIVMDSQNRLVPDMAHLQRFAPGGDLHGKLIYIEPDAEHPIAVNVFDKLGRKPNETLVRSAASFVSFFLRAGMQSDTTTNMDTALAYLIPAAMALPDPTVFTIEDILLHRVDKQHFHSLHPRVQQWLNERIVLKKEGNYASTFDALRSRIDRFGSDDLFRGMFEHPRALLDFATEIANPQVILINTNKAILQQAAPAFGRFFMASIFFAAQKRLLSRTDPIPTFFYIDEAADYISEDRTTIDIIDQARKLQLGVILSTHGESQIANPAVLAALRRTAIHTKTLHPRGSVSISQRGNPPQRVEFQDRQFKDMPRMSPEEWNDLILAMRKRYSAPPSTPPPPSSSSPPAQER